MRTKILSLILMMFLNLSCSNNSHEKKEKSSAAVDATPVSFDVDGYYLPADTIKYRDFLIENILISTSDSTTADRYKFITAATINLVSQEKGKWEIKSPNFHLQNKSLQLTFQDDRIGIIKMNLNFLGQNGPINDNVKENETIVMKGVIDINNDYHKNLDFKYFAGD